LAQSVSAVHEVLQMVPLHEYAPHEVVGWVHEPTPLQVPTWVATPAVHDAVPHEAEAPG